MSIEITSNPNEIKQLQQQTQKAQAASYEQIIAELNGQGIKTTRIKADKGEATFEDYGAALSDEMQQLIMDSFDCEADYELQRRIAGLFTDSNAINNGNFASACRQLGFQATGEAIKSTMIPDNKGDGKYDRDIETHHLMVYTITDPNTGAQIKIVDSNGNGAIETEELFMNQILEGISTNIGEGAFRATQNAGSAFGLNTGLSNNSNIEIISRTAPQDENPNLNEKHQDSEKMSSKIQISEAQFKQVIKEVADDLMKKENLNQEKALSKAEQLTKEVYEVGTTFNSSNVVSANRVLNPSNYV